MKTPAYRSTLIITAASALLAVGGAQAASVPLLTNTNGASDITFGDLYNFQIINSGTTAFFGVPYVGGPMNIPAGEQLTGVLFETYLLGIGGTGSFSVNFYAGDPASGVLAAISGFTAGIGTTIAATDDPFVDNLNADTSAFVAYNGSALDPFAEAANGNGFLWIGVTNTGAEGLALYSGGVNGDSTPAPAYTADAPLGVTANDSLNPEVYYFIDGNPDPEVAMNAVPYVNLSGVTETVPEPSTMAFGIAAGLGLLVRRKRNG